MPFLITTFVGRKVERSKTGKNENTTNGDFTVIFIDLSTFRQYVTFTVVFSAISPFSPRKRARTEWSRTVTIDF